MDHHKTETVLRVKTTALILVAMSTLLGVAFLGGCGDDKDGSGSVLAPQTGSIEGTWDLARVISKWNGQTYEVPPEIVESDPMVYEFRADGTGEMRYKGKTHHLTWRTQGNRMYLESATMTFEVYTFSVTATELTFQFDVEDEGEVYHISHIFDRL